MILACAQCSAKFKVPDGAIGAGGRIVRCSACQHEWLQAPLDWNTETSSSQQKQDPTGEQHNVELKAIAAHQEEAIARRHTRATRPSHVEEEGQPFYSRWYILFLMRGMLICALIFLGFMSCLIYRPAILAAAPQLKVVYEVLGLQDIENVRFEMIDCTLSQNQTVSTNAEPEKVELSVKVIIRNAGQEDKKLDAVRFSIYTKDREYLGEYTMYLHKTIAAQAEETIEGILNRVPKDVTFVIIEMGNVFDIAVRSQRNILDYKE